ncbi:fasciclin domain-containing protein [Aquimarina mytili]|uniref:Fasciclin domain-containing protein n=1 Tax=Aquimarina mytili TaxID=874423 RepID=A0A937D9L7_9FLAO|nr:fasciclin domain-containing protein [Aquimarina mytili]MBL0685180.1 fasciclin domain-containing protein [Aquimarina mytili]
MKIKNFFKVILITVFVATTYSCSDDDDTTFPPVSETIADFVAANPDYSSLLAALERADLVTTLSGQGSFTVFAPDNAAFEEFLNGAALTDVPVEDLRAVLLNHVLGAEVTSGQITTGYQTNLAEFSSYIDKTGDAVTINGASRVTVADIDRSNGVIHAIDKVIGIPTMLDFVTLDPNLSSLASVASTNSNDVVVATLGNEEADLTLLAPDNAAFTALGDVSGLSSTEIEQILLNHAISGSLLSTALSTSYGSTLASYGMPSNGINLSIYINTDDGVSFNGISDVTTADIRAVNGVIHIVDAVITLPDVTTFATADPTFSTLATALGDASLVLALQAENGSGTPTAPFTIFAPTNAAFTALGDLPTGNALTNVLTYHVIENNNVRSTGLAAVAGAVETVNGADVTITADPATVEGGGNEGNASNIIVVDVQASNGVIHAIDRVLLPPVL